MSILSIDIETVATQSKRNRKFILDQLEIKAPGNYKKQETIDKWVLDNSQRIKDEAVDKTVFSPDFGEIITIGCAFDDGCIHTFQRGDNISEFDILSQFLTLVDEKTKTPKGHRLPLTWVGHNALSFDFPYIKKRAIILGAETFGIHIPVERFDKNAYDTMTQWAGYGKSIKMDTLAFILGIDGKDGIDGSMVGGMFERGEYQAIAEYCADDVRIVREIYSRMN